MASLEEKTPKTKNLALTKLASLLETKIEHEKKRDVWSEKDLANLKILEEALSKIKVLLTSPSAKTPVPNDSKLAEMIQSLQPLQSQKKEEKDGKPEKNESEKESDDSKSITNLVEQLTEKKEDAPAQIAAPQPGNDNLYKFKANYDQYQKKQDDNGSLYQKPQDYLAKPSNSDNKYDANKGLEGNLPQHQYDSRPKTKGEELYDSLTKDKLSAKKDKEQRDYTIH